jgi:hypothetical protein
MGMVNRVVPRARCSTRRWRSPAHRRDAALRPGAAKQAVNQAEDRMGLRDPMDATFALHHLAHAHNALTSPDHLGGRTRRAWQAEVTMDLTLSARAAFRAEARAGWRERAAPALPSGDTAEGFALHRAGRKLFEARWSVVSWPRATAGARPAVEWLLFEEEYYRAGAPQRISQNGIFLLAPTLFEFGTDEQKERSCRAWPPPTICGRRAGRSRAPARPRGRPEPRRRESDAAAGASAARRPGARAAPSATGCSASSAPTRGGAPPRPDYFLVSLRAPGVTVRPVGRLDGDAGFAEVFLDDVFVPTRRPRASAAGLERAMATTASERGLTLRSRAASWPRAPAVELWRERRATDLRDAVCRLDGRRGLPPLHAGVGLRRRGARVEHQQDLLVGARRAPARDGAAPPRCSEAELDGAWMKAFQFALAGPIYAGTNEIQKKRDRRALLGLPRNDDFALTESTRRSGRAARELFATGCPPARRARGLERRAAAPSAGASSCALACSRLFACAWASSSGRWSSRRPAARRCPSRSSRRHGARPLVRRGATAPSPAAPLRRRRRPRRVFLVEDAAGLARCRATPVTLEPASPSTARRLVRVRARPARASAWAARRRRATRAIAARWAPAASSRLGRRMLEMTVAYVKVRQQFGRR